MCILESTFGELQKIDLKQVVAFRKVSDSFQPASPQTVASALRQELGRQYEVITAGKFVIAAPSGRARLYGEVLDPVYRSTLSFFSRRNFALYEIDMPLVAIVFPDEATFFAYAEARGKAVDTTLRGYYDPASNRMFFYDEVGEKGGLGNTARSTLIHEAIHQFCFNSGLNSRLAEQPAWVVEGLALTLESDHTRTGSGQRSSRINSERLKRYHEFAASSRKQFDLAAFIADDKSLFGSSPLDAYAVAWGITFYLMETRSAEFSSYLQLLQQRSPTGPYPASQRLTDFQQVFGQDVSRMQVEWQRYLSRLE
jgi:hypothetical protein